MDFPVILGVEESEYYLQAIEESKKQQENGKLLVQTELRMRLDMVKRLAKFEEDRINQFFNVAFRICIYL